MHRLPHILTAAQLATADAHTCHTLGLQPWQLVGRAAAAFVARFTNLYPTSAKVLCVCGTGHNGADGLAIAVALNQAGYNVQVTMPLLGEKPEADLPDALRHHLTAWRETSQPLHLEMPPQAPLGHTAGTDAPPDVVIDALLGTGLQGTPRPEMAAIIAEIMACEVPVVSVDMPSGLPSEVHHAQHLLGSSSADVVQATHTLTFHTPKWTLLLPEWGAYCGRVHVLPIGLIEPDSIATTEGIAPFYNAIPPPAASGWPVSLLPPLRPTHVHKGTYGHALLLAGSSGKMGAAVLAAQAALRMGVGLLTVAGPRSGRDVMQIAVPEAMYEVVGDDNIEHLPPAMDRFDAVAIGPGIGREYQTQYALEQLEAAHERHHYRRIILDADALNLLGTKWHTYTGLLRNAIVTPHPKEFDRLMGPHTDTLSRIRTIEQLQYDNESARVSTEVVLKGAFTATISQETLVFNGSGTPALARGGSGDVLTGMLLGAAAAWPTMHTPTVVFLHGRAGELAERTHGTLAMTARDLIDHIGPTLLATPLARENYRE